MAAIKALNPQADLIGARHALSMNIVAAKGLADVVKTNLGPRGTMKMLVSGAGLIKVTKDGKVLLDEMQIQHPTAAIIARTATAQEEQTGDGTTTNVLFTGELLAQAERYLAEGLHPRVIVDGIEAARERCLQFLDEYQIKVSEWEGSDSVKQNVAAQSPLSRDLLIQVARTALRTKLPLELADHMTEIVVSAVECIYKGDKTLDLSMIETMVMKHQSALDTRFVDGLVLDHGARHPNMNKRSTNCYILILNVSLEYEKSEVNAGFYYRNAEERAKLAAAERKFTDDKVKKIIDFKREIEAAEGKPIGFIIINQKGIDPISLDLLQKAGIVGIRRAKRRNMERLARACGGYAVNSLESLEKEVLGHADEVYEHVLGEDKFTFIEGCRNGTSCTILIKGPNDHTIRQIQDAVHDGLRAVKNVIEDQSVLPGGGAFELAAHLDLHQFKSTVQGRAKIGVAAFADALLIIPKVLAQNSGFDAQATLIELLDEAQRQIAANAGKITASHVGLDVETGKAMLADKVGVVDCHRVKKQLLHLGSLIAIKLLLVDEVMRAGRKMGAN